MITERIFGKIHGLPIPEITLHNALGTEVSFITWGATMRSLYLRTAEGRFTDICLGYDSLEEYMENDGHFGGTVGRFANRIGGASFELDGTRYDLSVNDPPNQLHGGFNGFDRKIWAYRTEAAENRVIFTTKSADGEEGFPGEVEAEAIYTLTEDNTLIFDFRARTDKATPVNLTNHWYFNLNGHDRGDVLNHQLQIDAESYTPTNENMIPTGAMATVDGTPLDFRQEKPISADFDAVRQSPQRGYDHNFVLGDSGKLKIFAVVSSPETGIRMAVATDMEGVQLYTGNWIGHRRGKGNCQYGDMSGMCLETQHFPDCVNHPEFPSAILRPGEMYCHRAEFRFDV